MMPRNATPDSRLKLRQQAVLERLLAGETVTANEPTYSIVSGGRGAREGRRHWLLPECEYLGSNDHLQAVELVEKERSAPDSSEGPHWRFIQLYSHPPHTAVQPTRLITSERVLRPSHGVNTPPKDYTIQLSHRPTGLLLYAYAPTRLSEWLDLMVSERSRGVANDECLPLHARG